MVYKRRYFFSGVLLYWNPLFDSLVRSTKFAETVFVSATEKLGSSQGDLEVVLTTTVSTKVYGID